MHHVGLARFGPLTLVALFHRHALGPAPLPGSRGEANHQCGEGEAKGRRESWLGPAPPPYFLGLCDGTSANRFVAQDTAQFICHFLRGFVTTRRLFLQTLERDRFEVSSN